MNDQAAQRIFIWADRAFWLIWLGFPVLIWLLVMQVLDSRARLAALAPEQAACLAGLPQVVNFSATGQLVFWSAFGIEMAIYAALLAMAHWVIHCCAGGRVFVLPMIGMLRRIGIVIAVYPLISLLLLNLSMAAYVATGDMVVFIPDFALDLPVLGVGLLLMVMAAAMRMAARLHQDAELTI